MALGALTLAFFAANFQLLAGWVTERVDGANFFAPYYAYLARVVQSGHWLLWNPFSNAGSPDFAEPQVGALSPLTLAFAMLAGPSAFAFRLYWLCLWLLGGVGMFVYARSLGAPVWGRLLGGLSFVFCGYYMGHAQHLSVVYATSFLPWIVWRLDRALLTGRRGPAGEAGALWGLSALAGNPALTIGTGLFLAAFAGVRVVGSGVPLRRAFTSVAILGAIGAIVMAPSIFSFKYESQGYSDRSGPLPREMVVGSNAIQPSELAGIFNPYVPIVTCLAAASETKSNDWSPIYFGAVPLVLAAFALVSSTRRRLTWTLLAVGLLFLGLTLGTTLPLRSWLYDLVPPTRYFRHPNMFRIYFIFAVIAVATLATVRLECWRQRGFVPRGEARRLAVVAAIFASIGAGVLGVTGWRLGSLGADGKAALLHAAIVWAGLAGVCALLAARPAMLARVPALFVSLALVDMLGAHYLSAESAFAIGSGASGRPALNTSPVELGAQHFARTASIGANEHLYRHEPVYCSYAALLNVQHLLSAESAALTQVATGHERIWFSPEGVEAPLSDEALALLARETATRRAPVLLMHTRDSMLHRAQQAGSFAAAAGAAQDVAPSLDAEAIRGAPSAVRVPFEVQTYRANELSLKVVCPSDGWLLVTDRWSRSWRGTVNGIEVPIDGGNFFFRLVPVRAGVNVVAMEFRPFLLWPLLTASWGTLLVVGLAAAFRALRRSATRAGAPTPAFSTRPLPCALSS